MEQELYTMDYDFADIAIRLANTGIQIGIVVFLDEIGEWKQAFLGNFFHRNDFIKAITLVNARRGCSIADWNYTSAQSYQYMMCESVLYYRKISRKTYSPRKKNLNRYN